MSNNDQHPLSDDRLDELVRSAALAGPAEPSRNDGLPALTRLLIACGAIGVAGVAIGVTLVFTPSPTPAPVEVAQSDNAPTPPERVEPATFVNRSAIERPEPSFQSRSMVVAQFSPEESDRLAALFFPETPGSTGVDPETHAEPNLSPGLANSDDLMAIGRLLRSADIARDTLALMSPDEQLEACRLWSTEPSLRPIAFDHLSRLSMDPSVSVATQRVVEKLALDPALRSWLTSYGLAWAGTKASDPSS
ncbi:MAG: hypothetical protein AAGI53_15310 [Planctomycetota bacterium]